MANQDDNTATTGWFSPTDVLRRVQDLGAQLANAARAMSDASTDAESPTLPMAQWGERAVELSTLWVTPMRAVLQEQQDLIEAISSWAEEQRKLADRFAELAQRHRETTEQVLAVLNPTLDNLDRMAGRKRASKRGATPRKQNAG